MSSIKGIVNINVSEFSVDKFDYFSYVVGVVEAIVAGTREAEAK